MRRGRLSARLPLRILLHTQTTDFPNPDERTAIEAVPLLYIFQRHLRSLVRAWVWVWEWFTGTLLLAVLDSTVVVFSLLVGEAAQCGAVRGGATARPKDFEEQPELGALPLLMKCSEKAPPATPSLVAFHH